MMAAAGFHRCTTTCGGEKKHSKNTSNPWGYMRETLVLSALNSTTIKQQFSLKKQDSHEHSVQAALTTEGHETALFHLIGQLYSLIQLRQTFVCHFSTEMCSKQPTKCNRNSKLATETDADCASVSTDLLATDLTHH